LAARLCRQRMMYRFRKFQYPAVSCQHSATEEGLRFASFG
jgi:hypothetical protein